MIKNWKFRIKFIHLFQISVLQKLCWIFHFKLKLLRGLAEHIATDENNKNYYLRHHKILLNTISPLLLQVFHGHSGSEFSAHHKGSQQRDFRSLGFQGLGPTENSNTTSAFTLRGRHKPTVWTWPLASPVKPHWILLSPGSDTHSELTDH